MWITLKLRVDIMDHKLFEAARTGDIATLDLLLQEDPLLLNRLSLSSLENPLHVSAFSGQAAFAAELLRHKPGLANELNHQEFSPLHIASAAGELGVVREILSVGQGDVCLVKGKDRLLPLHCAAQRGRSEVIKMLVSYCSDSLKEVTMASLETPLHISVKNNQVEATKVLLEEMNTHDMSGIANWQNREGNTVLHLATLGKHLEIVEMLIGERRPIASRVDPNISNGRGLTPKDILDLVLETQGSGSVPEMYKLVQIFQKIEAINGKEASITKPNRSNRPASAPFPINLWNMLDWEIQDMKDPHRDALLVVSVLIATVTYQGVVAPPGSFKTEENGVDTGVNPHAPRNGALGGKIVLIAGQAIMASDLKYFTLYAVFNAIGFLASISMISLLTKRFPLRDWLRLCIISMLTTYIIAIFYISPTQDKKPPMYVVLALSSLLVLREIVLFTRSLFKIVRKIK